MNQHPFNTAINRANSVGHSEPINTRTPPNQQRSRFFNQHNARKKGNQDILNQDPFAVTERFSVPLTTPTAQTEPISALAQDHTTTVHPTMQANPGMNETLWTCLNGFTSDHTWVSMRTSYYDKNQKKKFTVNGVTWNTLNWCKNKTDNGGSYANNPLNISENQNEYLCRRRLQLDEIINNLVKNESNTARDFILLQEADWVFNPILLKEYTDKLKKLTPSWGIIISPQRADQQLLVTLYNTATLEVKNSWSCFGANVGKNKQLKYRGFACEFKHKASGLPIVVVNGHLNYELDNRRTITHFQQEMITLNKYAIIGCDTNHPEGIDNDNMIGGNCGRATNFCENPARPGFYTVQDKRIPIFISRIDGFYVSPTQDTYAEIIETSETYFKLNDGGQSVSTYFVDPSTQSNVKLYSLLGNPWKTRLYYLIDLKNKLIETDPAKTQNIIKEFENYFKLQSHENFLNLYNYVEYFDSPELNIILPIIQTFQGVQEAVDRYAPPNAPASTKNDLKSDILAEIANIQTIGEFKRYYMFLHNDKIKSILQKETGFHGYFVTYGNTNTWQTVVFALKDAVLRFAKQLNPESISAEDDRLFRYILSSPATRWLTLTSDTYLSQYDLWKKSGRENSQQRGPVVNSAVSI